MYNLHKFYENFFLLDLYSHWWIACLTTYIRKKIKDTKNKMVKCLWKINKRTLPCTQTFTKVFYLCDIHPSFVHQYFPSAGLAVNCALLMLPDFPSGQSSCLWQFSSYPSTFLHFPVSVHHIFQLHHHLWYNLLITLKVWIFSFGSHTSSKQRSTVLKICLKFCFC